MNNPHKHTIRTVIEARIEQLQILLSSNAVSQIKTEELADEATRADTLAGITVDSALLNKAHQEHNALQRQLSRIDHESFGQCKSCGEEIAIARLAMVPTTQLCIHCAAQQD
jgi:DnaK suppressor protein